MWHGFAVVLHWREAGGQDLKAGLKSPSCLLRAEISGPRAEGPVLSGSGPRCQDEGLRAEIQGPRAEMLRARAALVSLG